MPLLGCYKKGDELYLFASLCRRYGDYILDVNNCMDYPIHKFKNCVVGFSGSISLLYKFIKSYDFNSVPEDFDVGYLVRHLYPFYLEFCATEDSDALIKDNYLCTSEFNLFILGHNHCVYLDPSTIGEVDGFVSSGVNDIINTLHRYCDEMPPLQFLEMSFRKTVKYSNKVDYPFLLVSGKDIDSLLVMNENGDVALSDTNDEWRKIHA